MASAAPSAPMPMGPTSATSSTTLITEAMAINWKGCLESPMPLNIADTRLYPYINTMPYTQVTLYCRVYSHISWGVLSHRSTP